MGKKKVIIIIFSIIIVLAILVGIIVCLNLNKTNEKENVKQGILSNNVKLNFLDFTVYDINENEIDLFDYRGKPIILNYWTSTNECAEQLNMYNSIYPEVAEKINFLFINLTDEETESKKFAERFLEKYQFNLPIFFDIDKSAARSYNVKEAPTTIFIDKDGNIINVKTEALSEDMIRANIDILLGNY